MQKPKMVFRVEINANTENDGFDWRNKIEQMLIESQAENVFVGLTRIDTDNMFDYAQTYKIKDYAAYLDHCANLWESNHFGEPDIIRAEKLRQQAKELRANQDSESNFYGN